MNILPGQMNHRKSVSIVIIFLLSVFPAIIHGQNAVKKNTKPIPVKKVVTSETSSPRAPKLQGQQNQGKGQHSVKNRSTAAAIGKNTKRGSAAVNNEEKISNSGAAARQGRTPKGQGTQNALKENKEKRNMAKQAAVRRNSYAGKGARDPKANAEWQWCYNQRIAQCQKTCGNDQAALMRCKTEAQKKCGKPNLGPSQR